MHPTKKVLYVITKANWGGAQRYVFMLARTAHKAGYDVVVATGGTGILTDQLAAEGIRSVPISMRQRRSVISDILTFGPLFSLVRLLRTERPDVVHLNSAKAGGLGAFAARIAGVPRIIFTAHGWEFNAPRPFSARLLIKTFSWLTVILSHRTIAVSDAVRADTRAWPGTKSRMCVVKNGILCPALIDRSDARARLGIDSAETPVVGMMSELIPTKNINTAIDAVAEVVKQHPNTKLVVMGEGPERERLAKQIISKGLTSRVQLAGFIPDASTLLQAFDLFLHTSHTEALGLAILEAGCAKLPVIASRVGGIPEIIEDGVSGLLIAPSDTQGFASAIHDLIQNPERARTLGEHLYERVTRDFTEARMTHETLALY